MTQPAAGEAVHFERRQIDPMQLCIDFLGDDADEENQRILAEILAELEENKCDRCRLKWQGSVPTPRKR